MASREQTPSTPQQTLTNLAQRFNPQAAAGLDAVYQLCLTGEGGGVWHLTVRDQACRLAAGPAERPDVTIRLSVGDWQELVAGRLSGYMAFMEGKLQVLGDFGLATRLAGLFGL